MWDALIYAGLAAVIVVPTVAVCIAAGRADGVIEDSREGAEVAKFTEPYIEVRCIVQGACRLAFTREEWAEMDDAERDRAVRDAAMIGAAVTWRYAPSERKGAAK